jgi:hypothetical protein
MSSGTARCEINSSAKSLGVRQRLAVGCIDAECPHPLSDSTEVDSIQTPLHCRANCRSTSGDSRRCQRCGQYRSAPSRRPYTRCRRAGFVLPFSHLLRDDSNFVLWRPGLAWFVAARRLAAATRILSYIRAGAAFPRLPLDPPALNFWTLLRSVHGIRNGKSAWQR